MSGGWYGETDEQASGAGPGRRRRARPPRESDTPAYPAPNADWPSGGADTGPAYDYPPTARGSYEQAWQNQQWPGHGSGGYPTRGDHGEGGRRDDRERHQNPYQSPDVPPRGGQPYGPRGRHDEQRIPRQDGSYGRQARPAGGYPQDYRGVPDPRDPYGGDSGGYRTGAPGSARRPAPPGPERGPGHDPYGAPGATGPGGDPYASGGGGRRRRQTPDPNQAPAEPWYGGATGSSQRVGPRPPAGGAGSAVPRQGRPPAGMPPRGDGEGYGEGYERDPRWRGAPPRRRPAERSPWREDADDAAPYERDPRDDERGYRGSAGYDDEPEDSAFGLLGRGDEDDDERGGRGRSRGRRDKSRRRGGPVAVLAVLVVFALIGGLAYFGYGLYREHFGPPPDYASLTGVSTTADVRINAGDSADQMAQELFQAGIVKSVGAFVKAADANPSSVKIQPGVYLLHRGMKASAVVLALLNPKNRDDNSQIIVTAGERSSEIFAALASKTHWTIAAITAAATSGRVDLPSWAHNKIEGFLAPGSYNLTASGLTPTSLITQMVDATNTELAQAGVTQAAASKLNLSSPYDLLIVASLARAEGRNSSDLGKIARVIYNRLDSGQYLDFDTSLLYGLGRRSPQPSLSDLENGANPYNLSSRGGHHGLPPTPIDTPDMASLRAAVSPTPGNYFYFCAVDARGTTKFADTNSQWQAIEREYPQACG